MTEAMYDLLYIIDIVSNTIFRVGLLYLIYRYIEVRRLKA